MCGVLEVEHETGSECDYHAILDDFVAYEHGFDSLGHGIGGGVVEPVLTELYASYFVAREVWVFHLTLFDIVDGHGVAVHVGHFDAFGVYGGEQ